MDIEACAKRLRKLDLLTNRLGHRKDFLRGQ